jgi:signal peptidase II
MHEATDRHAERNAEAATPGIDVRRLIPIAAVALVVIAADQAAKSVIRAWLAVGESWPSRDALIAITRVENSGAAFGILQGAGSFLLAVSVVGLGAIIAFVLLTPLGRWYRLALGAVLGGAIGNFIDRIVRGTVTDFVDPRWYPSFNVADSAIVCGVVALIALSFFDGRPAASEGSSE